jgi:Domain of unknown function (DUF4157)
MRRENHNGMELEGLNFDHDREDLLEQQHLKAKEHWAKLHTIEQYKHQQRKKRLNYAPHSEEKLVELLGTVEQREVRRLQSREKKAQLIARLREKAPIIEAEAKAMREAREQDISERVARGQEYRAGLLERMQRVEISAKRSEARVERGYGVIARLDDDTLFGSTEPLETLNAALEAEAEQAENIVSSLEQTEARFGALLKLAEPSSAPQTTQIHDAEPATSLHAQLEAAIGEALPQFNIKTDAEADQKARAIGAIAFTQGDTIYFQSGKFDPTSVEGFKLLVHEATHISQQAKGIVPDGVDSSPELEQAAQQKADQISSPAKTFTNLELMGFANQLKAQYAQLGRTSERFDRIAETWQGMPRDAQNKIRSRFFLGMNDNALETIKLREAFDSRLNASLAVPQALENPFLKPSGINVQFDTPRTTLEPARTVIDADARVPTFDSIPELARVTTPRVPFRSTHSTARAIQRQQQNPQPRADQKALFEGTPINKTGIARDEAGLVVRDKPDGAQVRKLNFNDRFFVAAEISGKSEKWYRVMLQDGTLGFVVTRLVKTNLPDPEARLHKVQAGEKGFARNIAEKEYNVSVRKGYNAGYVVALAMANKDSGALVKAFDPNDWENTGFKANNYIWIPGPALLERVFSQYGQHGGKIMQMGQDAWDATKNFVMDQLNPMAMIGCLAGIVEGFFKDIWDNLVALKDLAVMIFDVIKSIFTGSIISDMGKMWDWLKNLSLEQVQDMVSAMGDQAIGAVQSGLKAWNEASAFDRGRMRGKVIGYILGEIAIAWATAGIGTVIAKAGMVAKLAKVAGKIPGATKIITGAQKANKQIRVIAGTAKTTVANTVKKVVQTGEQLLPKNLLAGRARKEAVDALESPGFKQAMEEAGEKTAKAKELPIAIATAAGIAATNDTADTPVAAVLTQLNVLKGKFKWIKEFKVEAAGDKSNFFLIASSIPIYRGYTAKQRSQARAANYQYDPKTRTDKQLLDDAQGKSRTNETPQQAQARTQKAQRELDFRKTYKALGEKPPRINITDNDRMFGTSHAAHTLDRHGWALPLSDMRDRVMGIGRWAGSPQHFAYKWIDESTANKIIREHMQSDWEKIRECIARTGAYDHTWDTGKRTGDGFFNSNYRAGESGVSGGASLPRIPVRGETSWVTIRLRLDPVTNQIYVLTAFPLGRIGI